MNKMLQWIGDLFGPIWTFTFAMISLFNVIGNYKTWELNELIFHSMFTILYTILFGICLIIFMLTVIKRKLEEKSKNVGSDFLTDSEKEKIARDFVNKL